MPRLKLNFACGLYDRMQALYTGEVRPDGIDLNFIPIELPRPIFDRMSGGLEFDVAEYSISEFVQRFANAQCPFVAIPVFPSRTFRHSFISIRSDAGIDQPRDLEGKRVGVPLFTMTAAVFIRGLLADEYGVDLDRIHWVEGAMNDAGAHGAPTILPLLKPVDLEVNGTGRSLGQLLAAGEIDATIGTSLPREIGSGSSIRRLFPDFRSVEKQYYRKTGIFPIMHLVAIRRDVYEANPFVATSLYDAFVKSKMIALERMRNLRALRYMLPWLADDIDEMDDVFGSDPWPYGVEPNRPTLEALVRHLRDQHFIDRLVPIETLFVDTFG